MADKAIEEILGRQKRAAELINNFQTNTSKQKAIAQMTLQDYQARREVLESYWREFCERDYQLAPLATSLKERSYFAQGLYDFTLSAYLLAKSWLCERISVLSAQAVNPVVSRSASASTQSAQASLERVRLPKFNGFQRDWQGFKTKFTSLVLHDASLPTIIKFEHLANALEGEAAEGIKCFDLVDENFQSAWDALCSRYDIPLLRFSTHFNALLRLPSADKESGDHLSKLLHTALESKNVFTSLKLPVQHWDMIFVQLLENKLPSGTRLERTRIVKSAGLDFPTFTSFQTFLQDRIQSLDVVRDVDVLDRPDSKTCEDGQSKTEVKKVKSSKSNTSKNVSVHVASQSNKTVKSDTCSFCQGSHYITKCPKFTALTPTKRKEHAVSANLCFNCLSARHRLEACTSKGSCYVCGKRHHSKLHLEEAGGNSQPSSVGQPTTVHLAATETSSPQLLATAMVVLQSPTGVRITARALIDSCAERSFVSESIAQLLALRRTSVNIAVSGLNETINAVSRGAVKLTLRSLHDPNFSLDFSALVVKRVSNLLPKRQVASGSWDHIEGLQLADPSFGKPGKVDCILSAAVYGAVMLPGIQKGLPSCMSPVALNTVFGWVLVGDTGEDSLNGSTSVHHLAIDHQLSEAVSRFWESEEVPMDHRLSIPEQECWDHFKQTYRQNAEGRFVVRLPFRRQPKFVGSDRIARACMNRLERRFERHPDCAAAYHAFMQEYVDLGHMEIVSAEDLDFHDAYFLPHHPVFKKDGSNKIRVVFNGSQRDEQGNSLNDCLHPGPKLQEDIVIILIRWSFFQFVFTCDIVKNFRQMLVDISDTRWQLIFWRFESTQPLLVWRLLTVTYGTASAPFHANACLLELAQMVKQSLPLASVLLLKHRYVDDFLAGGDDLEEAKQAQQEIVDSLKLVGMSVDKCAANHAELLSSGLQESKSLDEKDVVSTLGMRWSPADDVFHFHVKLPPDAPVVTKRSILSEVSKLFDPAGFLAPVVVRAKLLIQHLWLLGFDWNVPVSDRIEAEWLDYRRQLAELESIRIPRWSGTVRASSWQLHGFCDASERAFAAMLFVVVSGSERSPKLLVAKSKVSPIKVVSLPKLELCAAALLANLASRVLGQIDRMPDEVHCWSDSKVVLAWLKSHPSRWKSYVANRVSDIISLLPTATWHHVSSPDNPADLASRGCSPSQLREASIWWSGPAWLRFDKSQWPVDSSDSGTDLEARRKFHVWFIQDDWSELLNRYSSFDRLVGVLAYCLRWRNNTSIVKQHRRLSFLSAEELSAATITLFRLVQSVDFASEIQILASSLELPQSHNLKRLMPFIGSDGLLRVGRRPRCSSARRHSGLIFFTEYNDL